MVTGGFDAYRKFKQAEKQREQAANLQYKDLTPTSVDAALNQDRMQSTANMPGYGQALDNINQSTAGSLRALQGNARGSSLVGGINMIASGRNAALGNLAAQNANNRQIALSRLRGSLMARGRYEDLSRQTFDNNKAALLEAATRNEEGGWNDIGNTLRGVESTATQVGLAYATGGLSGLGGGGAKPATGVATPEVAGAMEADVPATSMSYKQSQQRRLAPQMPMVTPSYTPPSYANYDRTDYYGGNDAQLPSRNPLNPVGSEPMDYGNDRAAYLSGMNNRRAKKTR
jgi:hypothetical protein